MNTKQKGDTKTYMNQFPDLKIAVAGTGYVGLSYVQLNEKDLVVHHSFQVARCLR